MRCCLLLIFTFGLSLAVCSQNPTWLSQALKDQFLEMETAVNCSDKIQVMDKTFNKLVRNAFTKIAPNVAGEITQGSGANIKLSDENTTAEIQSTFILSDRWLLNFGFNGTVKNNVASIFSGKEGLESDWGTKLNFSWAWKRGLFYKGVSTCESFHLNRKLYLLQLYNRLNTASYLDTARRSLRNQIRDSSRIHLFSNSIVNAPTVHADGYEQLLNNYQTRSALFKYKRDSAALVQSMHEMVEDSVVSYETRTAQWTGYNILLFNAGIFFNQKSYTQFNPSPWYYRDRFHDTAYGNFGLTAGLSWYRVGALTQQNANASLVFQNQSNFDLPEKKISKDIRDRFSYCQRNGKCQSTKLRDEESLR